MNYQKTTLCAISLLISISTWGSEINASQDLQRKLFIGKFNLTQKIQQHVNINGLIGNDYVPTDKTGSAIMIGGEILKRLANESPLQFGVGLFHFFNSRSKGVINLESQFTNLSYRYETSHTTPLALIRAQITDKNNASNFSFEAGVGPDILRTDKYQEASLDGGVTIPGNSFKGHTSVRLATMLGLDWNFSFKNKKHAISVGYRFFYLGKGRLLSTNNQVLTNLETSNGTVNALVFGYAF